MYFVERFFEIVIAGGVGIFGGISAYIYRLTRTREPFNLWAFFAAIVIAFFVGNLFGSFVPKDVTYRDGLFMICGFLSYPFLGLLEKGGLNWITSFIPNGSKLKQKEENDNE